MEHGGKLDKRLRYTIARAVRRTIVLILGIMMSVVIRDGRWIALLGSLGPSRLRLIPLRCVLLRGLTSRWRKTGARRLLLSPRQALEVVVAYNIAVTETGRLVVGVVEALLLLIGGFS